jgi:hypothetical protein
MVDLSGAHQASELPHFTRDLFGTSDRMTAIGAGAIGGKAAGLKAARDILADLFPEGTYRGIEVTIPSLAVIGTDVFDAFIAKNSLYDTLDDGMSDDRIALAFQKTEFPVTHVGDLRGLVEKVKTPLAVRSSSLLEDASHEPFAGVYGTKMIPNNQPDADTRFKKLIEAIRFVYATAFFRQARGFRERTGHSIEEEKMAVVVQEVVGLRHQDRFYPTVSGVGRSFNFYPTGNATPEDGMVQLALGLGKTIVDGDNSWTYSPAYPKVDPPLTISDLLKQTQTRFWAVNMGKPPAFDPTRETEYLIHEEIQAAEMDDTIQFVASTYEPQNDRVTLGAARSGPRILNFAPILKMDDIPLNDLVRRVLTGCEEALGTGVEIEFAVTLDPLGRQVRRFGFLQVRPTVLSSEDVSLSDDDLVGDNVLVASDRALGHGRLREITDVVYVKPDVFQKKYTVRIAGEIEQINKRLAGAGREYVLICFGRIGSRDPWLGIPVDWGQISRARVIVEATLPDLDVELSQGSHFFHNMTSLQIMHFTVHHSGVYNIDWKALQSLPAVQETEHVRHVSFNHPLTVEVDGRHSKGTIRL